MWNNLKKAVTFSYDDGISQDIRLLEILNGYKLKCTFNLNSGLMKKPASWEYKGALVKRIMAEEINSIYKGHEIAVHGFMHLNLAKIAREEMISEIGNDKQELEKITGHNMTGMAYAFGAYNETAMEVIGQRGLKYSRTVAATREFNLPRQPLTWHPTCHHDDPEIFNIVERFINAESENPLLLYIWGHSYEFDGNNNWYRFEEVCKKISDRSDIFYGTNSEILGL